MVSLLRKYEENEFLIEEYTHDGETVSHIVRTLIMDDSMVEEVVPEPSIEEKTLYETQYQTMLIETSMSF